MSKKVLENLVGSTRKLSLTHKEEMSAMNLLIAGRTNCGKTRLLLKILEDELMDKYEEIFLICPTYKTNFSYQNWEFKDLKNWNPIFCELHKVNTTLSLIIENVKGKTLIILDDCASSKDVSLRKSVFTHLAQGGRHKQINTIVITQQINSIAKAYRDNLTRIITFYNPSKEDRDILFNTMCFHKKRDESHIMHTLMKNKYSYFDISLQYPWTCKVVLQHR